ncbi:MAG TPA: serine/threonine-protein kinase [Streptosporangiaceae bacterium]|jgi:serine/threonine protein kinase
MAHHDPLEPDDPRQIGAYRLTGRLGVGGQGIVYLAGSPAEPDEHVAVKLLHTDWLRDPTALGRLAKEVASARRVASFCTARVVDADLEARPPYIVSEYIEGPTLLTHVTQKGPLSGSRLVRLAVGAATALTAIHQAGVVHRDFKPGNIILGPDGPRVIDFGIAREQAVDPTGTTGIVGTPVYMAPEHFLGTPIGPAADVFAWASTMVYAATGRGPFTAPTIPAIMNRVINDAPTTGDLPEPLAGLIARCLAKDPEARPSSRDLLLGLLADTEQTVPGDGPVFAAASVAAQSGPTPFSPPPPNGDPAADHQDTDAGPGPRPAPSGPDPVHMVPPPAYGAPPTPPSGGHYGDTPYDAPAAAAGGPPPVPTAAMPPAASAGTGPNPNVQAMAGPPHGGSGPLLGPTPIGPPGGPGGPSGPGGAATPGGTGGPGKPRRGKLLAGIAGGVAAVLIVAGAGYLAFGRTTDQARAANDSPQAQSSPSTTQTTGNDAAGKNDSNAQQAAKNQQKGKKGTLGKGKRPGKNGGRDGTGGTGGKTGGHPGSTKNPSHPSGKNPPPAPPQPKANRYTAGQACGSGYRVLESHALYAKGYRVATTYLLYNDGNAYNCAVTMRSDTGTGSGSGRVTAFLQAHGSGGHSDAGAYKWYAGPLRVHAPKVCVRYGGSLTTGSATASWTSGYIRCG